MSGLSCSRKRQSRLGFTPLPSSSPAAKDYNKQIQDRAAAVTIQSSPNSSSRRRKRRLETDGANESMPTPAASYQHLREREIQDGSESEEPVRSTQRRSSTQTNKRTRQPRLDFSNIRDADSFSPPQRLSSPSRPQSTARNGMFGTQRKRPVVDISSDDEIPEMGEDQLGDQDSDEELPSPSKLSTRRASKGATNTGKMKDRVRGAQSQPVEENSDSESEAIRVSSGTKPVTIESEDEDDDMPTTIGTQRRKPRRKRSNSFIADSPPKALSSDDDIEIIEQPRKRRRKATDESEDEAGESDAMKTPARGSLKRRRQISRQEQEELAEDLDFLEPSSDVESPRKKRDARSVRKDARQSALEKLKRRRSKVNEAEPEGEQSAENEYTEVDESDGAEQYIPATKSSQMFHEDDYDEGFVESAEDEDDDTLGVPMPIEFTRQAFAKPKELFKHAVEWFVQKKINPAFSMDDEIYKLTFRKLNDEVDGLARSKFKSAAWTPEFTMVLNARPDLAYEQLDRHDPDHWMRDTCDACNRSGHPATYQIQFQGKPYHARTLEHIAGNEDEDDSSSEDDNNDEPGYDANGHEIPPESKIYYVGKFCMSNARTAHALQHWRYHLNQWIIEWLETNHYNTPAEVVKRDSWSTKKRRRYANKIADRLEQEGLVKSLYGDYKRNIDEARESKQGRFGGGD